MKPHVPIALAFFVLSVITSIAADDPRSRVKGPNQDQAGKRVIDPDRHVFGIPFGASEDEYIKVQGKPDGYVRLNDESTAMIYGSDLAVVFKSGKLAAVRITSSILDWELANEMGKKNHFGQPDYRLSNGIEFGMDRGQVRGILKNKLEGSDYRHHFTTEKARVELQFSHFVNSGDKDSAYTLHGLYVKHGARADEDPISSIPKLPKALRLPGMPVAPEFEGKTSFGGIGAILRLNDNDELEVLEVIPGMPAMRAQIRVGHLIRSINGEPTTGKGVPEVVSILRGEPETKVTLEVFDPKDKTNRTVELTRALLTMGAPDAPGTSTGLAIQTDQVLRLEGESGASAVVQFLAFKKVPVTGSDELETATYRWKYKTSGGPVTAGTNTVVNAYSKKPIGPNQFKLTSKSESDETFIKIGEFRIFWSYGFTNMGYLYEFPPNVKKKSLHGVSEFEAGP